MASLGYNKTTAINDEILVSKATMNAAAKLELSNVELSSILGVSEPQLSRIKNAQATFKQNTKEFELALLFIRLFRSLDSLLGGDDSSASKWLRGENLALLDKPINRIKKVEGLIDVLSYLDSRRAIV